MATATTPHINHMDLATIGDHQLAYRVGGKGAPLALVHGGFAAELLTVLERAEPLAGCRRILYHRRGYGRSPRPERVRPTTLAENAADLVGLLDHLSLDAVHLVGHSYGALVALATAASHPERVASLTLLEAPVPFSHPAGTQWLESVLPQGERYARGDMTGAVSGFYDVTLRDGWRQRMDQLAPGAFNDSVDGAPMAFESDLPGLEWTDGLSAEQVAAIRCPVLVLVGSRSRPAFLEARDVLRAWFPWCECVEVADADHMLPVSKAEDVATELATFVCGVAPPGTQPASIDTVGRRVTSSSSGASAQTDQCPEANTRRRDEP